MYPTFLPSEDMAQPARAPAAPAAELTRVPGTGGAAAVAGSVPSVVLTMVVSGWNFRIGIYPHHPR